MRPQQVLLALALGVVVGCDGSPSTYEQLGIAQASGRVTMDGEPLAKARVIFVEPGAGFSSVGETDENGEYVLMLNSSQEGVAPGEKVVRITTAYATEEEGRKGAETVPKRYNAASELKATVEPGKDHTFDFDLKSEGAAMQPKQVRQEDG